ncbi:predicted protein [Plenodomus lingam JN3]|uniref:Predicted protein n=1 Tax=Leptosphaeria maculans (strain JN3 / isolate v23.1.3 / race Av1-4-5-6-7-8) TaxID=985895 RepID=E5A8C2_LEPMJ|nr:predicted protein [Plenodomus lingam JN3]CBX99867.1 predicted protein [Plenodomus lingam JN3]
MARGQDVRSQRTGDGNCVVAWELNAGDLQTVWFPVAPRWRDKFVRQSYAVEKIMHGRRKVNAHRGRGLSLAGLRLSNRGADGAAQGEVQRRGDTGGASGG